MQAPGVGPGALGSWLYLEPSSRAAKNLMTDLHVALIETIIAAGESYYAEFKSAWHYGPEGRRERDIREVAKDVAEAVVAFSNSDGGDLLVGVEDDGAVTGVPWDGERLRYLVSAPTELVMAEGGVGVQVRTARLEGKTVLLFRVAEVAGEPVVTVDGRCLWRRGARTEPVPPKEIQRRREQVLGDVAYESTPVPEATLADLDASYLLDAFGTRFGHHPGQRELIKVADAGITHALRYWNLAEVRNGSTVLRRAALLLFASDPLRWHPNNRIRFRRPFSQFTRPTTLGGQTRPAAPPATAQPSSPAGVTQISLPAASSGPQGASSTAGRGPQVARAKTAVQAASAAPPAAVHSHSPTAGGSDSARRRRAR